MDATHNRVLRQACTARRIELLVAACNEAKESLIIEKVPDAEHLIRACVDQLDELQAAEKMLHEKMGVANGT